MSTLYTKLVTDEYAKASFYQHSVPLSASLLRAHHCLDPDQPLLLLRRDGSTAAILSDTILVGLLQRVSESTGQMNDPIVLVPNPSGPPTKQAQPDSEGGLPSLQDLYEGLKMVSWVLQRSDSRTVLPLSKVPEKVAAMWCRGLLTSLTVENGLAPFALPAGAPNAESLAVWLAHKTEPGMNDQLFCQYQEKMLEKFGVTFGPRGFVMRSMQHFPLFNVPTETEYYIGGLDFGLLPFQGSFQDLRVGFIVVPRMTKMQVDGEEVSRETEFADHKARAVCTALGAKWAGMQPFYLDVTDGTRHHILYQVHDSRMVVHTNCSPREAYSLLSGLLKGDIAFGNDSPQLPQDPAAASGSAAPAETGNSTPADTAAADAATQEATGDEDGRSDASSSKEGADTESSGSDEGSEDGEPAEDHPDALQPANSDAGWQVV